MPYSPQMNAVFSKHGLLIHMAYCALDRHLTKICAEDGADSINANALWRAETEHKITTGLMTLEDAIVEMAEALRFLNGKADCPEPTPEETEAAEVRRLAELDRRDEIERLALQFYLKDSIFHTAEKWAKASQSIHSFYRKAALRQTEKGA